MTASSQKKRKLAPFSHNSSPAGNNTKEAAFDREGLAAHVRSSPSSSPQPFTNTSSAGNSPGQSPPSFTTRNTPPRYLPPHLQDEVFHSREGGSQPGSTGGNSPSGAFANCSLDCGSSVDMSGSEYGANGTEQPVVSSPNRKMSVRSASPAKRSAAHLEDTAHPDLSDGRQSIPGSFDTVPDEEPTDFDQAMSGMSPIPDGTDTQETLANSLATTMQNTMTANTSATSFQSDTEMSSDHKLTNYTTAEIDEQVRKVHDAMNETLGVGDKGVVVATAWLARVLSRTSENLQNNDFTKASREGLIGPIDNSTIVPDGAFTGPFLHDMQGKDFIPLKPGLIFGTDYEVIPSSVWGAVVASYGLAHGQHQITRYATDAAPPGAPHSNIVYDAYPPTFTIRKIPHASNAYEPTPPTRSIDQPRKRSEQRGRGQISPDDAIQFISARSERFQHFLARCKEAAGIPLTRKVKLWKLTPSVSDIEVNEQADVSSPPATPITSQSTVSPPKLTISAEEFQKLEIGKDIEAIEAPDETGNTKYNGRSTMETFELTQDQTILLEEQAGGPAGGEFASDSKKRTVKIKNSDSTAPSTTTSGRTSPVNGGITTRSRAQRNTKKLGTVGLRNLGNTCYMNSALQCIRSVEELAIYFLSDKYKAEINAGNPLGHGGSMAKAYAGVVRGIYEGSGSFSPSNFKSALSHAQPLFSGYGQQDSQEFLSFLVDALHEDLNRILKKPYNENPDSDDKTVHDPQAITKLGNIYRDNHKARNDSIAMDLFNGFYKNTMECPHCEKVSVTFDPYSLVTLQLPIESTFQHTVTFVPLYGPPINHNVDIDKNATVKTLKEWIAGKHPGVSADRLWMTEVYNNKIYKVFDNQTTVAEANITGSDHIFLFELAQAPTNPPAKKRTFYTYGGNKADETPDMDSPKADCFPVPIFFRKKARYNGWDMMMHPLYISITRDEAKDYDVILKKVLIAVSNITSRQILMENDDNQSANAQASSNSGEAERDESAGEDGARISDRSVPSEDGYVEVSVTDTGSQSKVEGSTEASNGTETRQSHIPSRIMDKDYFLSPALRNQLFNLNFARSSDGPYCASMQSIENRVMNMYDRIKRERRASIDSSASEDSTASVDSSKVVVETEESDADDDEIRKPGDGFGNEDSLSIVDTSDDAHMSGMTALPEEPVENGRGGRRSRGKENKFGRNRKEKKKKGGKKAKRSNNRNHRPSNAIASPQSMQSPMSVSSPKSTQEDENSYYIQTGEGIVLDWYPESLEALFDGDSANNDELRGHWLSSEDGRSVPYFDDPILEAKRQRRADRKRHGLTLEDCFAETGKREILSEDNAWYCNRCKEMRQAAKTLEIWTIPDILIVHLKRFGGNRSFRDKLDVLVDYPITSLDMAPKVGLKEEGKEYMYDLFAVDNHYGGLGGGHYTAIAKNFNDGLWYDYNDSTCSKIGEVPAHSAAAYLLFYRRRSDKPLGPEYLQKIVTDARNPPGTDGLETTDETDSGEGKLGDRTSSLHGSPSASAGAGAGALSLVSSYNRHVDGAGTGADRNQTTNSTMTTLNDEVGLKRNTAQQRTDGNSGWNFDDLDNGIGNGLDEDDDEIPSDKASGGDNDSAYGEDLDVETGGHDSAAGRGSPIPFGPFSDEDVPLFSGGNEINGHYQDSEGVMGIDEDAVTQSSPHTDPPTTDIHLPDANIHADSP